MRRGATRRRCANHPLLHTAELSELSAPVIYFSFSRASCVPLILTPRARKSPRSDCSCFISPRPGRFPDWFLPEHVASVPLERFGDYSSRLGGWLVIWFGFFFFWVMISWIMGFFRYCVSNAVFIMPTGSIWCLALRVTAAVLLVLIIGKLIITSRIAWAGL